MHTQWESTREDDDGDDQTDNRITVVLVLPGREPDDQARGDDADVAQRIAQYVQDECAHVHRAVCVPGVCVPVCVPVVVVMAILVAEKRRLLRHDAGGRRLRGVCVRGLDAEGG